MDTRLSNGFQTARIIWAAISTNATKKTSLKFFWVLQAKTSFIEIESPVNWERVQYRNPIS